MKYAYLRVSDTAQNLARQTEAVKAFASDLDGVFSDKQTGKNFERPEYQRMKSVLVAGDEIVVKELDRLGRNKEGIKAELRWFRENGITVRILDVPTTLIDFQGQEWLRDMVNNILIEVLGAVAEQEREKINARRIEGVEAMPVVDGKRVSAKTGRGFGRPEKAISAVDFEIFREKQKSGEMTVAEICRTLEISRTTWYERVRCA